MLDLPQLTRSFAALGHPTKLSIFIHLLSTHSPITPTEVASHLNLNVSTASAGLSRLNEVGVLDRQATGRFVFYSVSQEFVTSVRTLMQ